MKYNWENPIDLPYVQWWKYLRLNYIHLQSCWYSLPHDVPGQYFLTLYRRSCMYPHNACLQCQVYSRNPWITYLRKITNIRYVPTISGCGKLRSTSTLSNIWAVEATKFGKKTHHLADSSSAGRNPKQVANPSSFIIHHHHHQIHHSGINISLHPLLSIGIKLNILYIHVFSNGLKLIGGLALLEVQHPNKGVPFLRLSLVILPYHLYWLENAGTLR